jgi:cellulose synthase/poly-beta-1,6-N-acetylglucosamine synthase-like glycosyltransferase
MLELACVLFWIFVGLWAAQGLLVVRYLAALLQFRHARRRTAYCPKAAAILCVRGKDPVLRDCVAALLDQDYPNYEVHVVVDSRTDPGWGVVQAAAAQRKPSRVRITTLTRRLDTCTRKLSAILQVISELDRSNEIVVLLDSDTVPYRTWLRDLAAPLADPRVGAASGNRWYMPDHPTWASLVRYAWNAAAVVQMYCYKIPWGGSMAIKTELFDKTGLLDCWTHAFGDDTALGSFAPRCGYRVVFAPSVLMANRGSCRCRNFFQFVQRQLLSARLHSPWWWAVVGHGVVTTAWLSAVIGLFLAALAAGSRDAMLWAGAALAAYMIGCPLLLALMELCTRRIIRARGERVDRLDFTTILKTLAVIPATQIIYGVALVGVLFLRQHRWRNVLYRVGGRQKVQVLDDAPCDPAMVIE